MNIHLQVSFHFFTCIILELNRIRFSNRIKSRYPRQYVDRAYVREFSDLAFPLETRLVVFFSPIVSTQLSTSPYTSGTASYSTKKTVLRRPLHSNSIPQIDEPIISLNTSHSRLVGFSAGIGLKRRRTGVQFSKKQTTTLF